MKMKPISALCLLSFVLPLAAFAAPFEQWFPDTSPKGVQVRVWGWGDEYSVRYEAEDGHAVVRTGSPRAYYYARQEADGALASTGIAVGDETDADRAVLVAIPLHLTDTSAAEREARQKRIQKLDGETGRAARWTKQKETMRRLREAQKKGLRMAPPSRPTLGTVKGLTVLIDFPITGSSRTTWSSVHPSVTKEQLEELLNGEDCTLYGNASSVHSYYHDVSNGRLDYSMAVIGPVTAPNPRSYYDDTSVKGNDGECARKLIGDIFKIIWNDANFKTKYLPLLQSLSTQDGVVRSLNIWFAGESATEWSRGLWAHKWAVGSTIASTYQFTAGGKTVSFGNYQITPITSTPGIYTFCHENGHMLCDFPDLYNYEESISGNRGVGHFSLMCGSADEANPPYFDAYLRTAAGWVEPQLLPSAGGTVTVRNNHTDVWKYENPKDPSEYYLIENRQKTGRDASIKGSGILIWRCYEWGNNCYPDPTTYLSGFASGVYRWNYELSLEQADGSYNIERGTNSGDKYDTWYAENTKSGGVFNDNSLPTAKWTDASNSGLELSDFSKNGETMSFKVAAYTPASPNISLAAALDNDRLAFVTGGDERWYGQTATSKVGGSAAKSGKIGDSESSWFKAVVEGAGEISFDWKVSSQKDYDLLEFSIDGVVQKTISGTTNWSTQAYEVGAGEHVFLWTYHKNASRYSGDDAGYVDHVVWTPDSERVAKPIITGPRTSVFAAPAEVILSCATAGATIHYTLDGSEPTEASALYERPIVISGDVTVRARAFKKGLDGSKIAEANYLLKAEPGVWTDDAERVRLSAAVDGNLVCVMMVSTTSSNWDGYAAKARSRTFLDWAANNGIYLVQWDYAKSSTWNGVPAAQWFAKLYDNYEAKSSFAYWQMFFAVPSNLDVAVATGIATSGNKIGSVTYAATLPSWIECFASILTDNGITPTPPVAAEVATVLGTSGIEWQNDSSVAWREEYPNRMRAGGLKNSNYTSTMSATVAGPGKLTFNYVAVSYSGSNRFSFSLNGTKQLEKRYQGNNVTDFSGTETYVIADADGATFSWICEVKDPDYDYTKCGVWIYDVVWTPEPVATPFVSDSEVVAFENYTYVSVFCATEDATIFYTLDGSDPTEASRYLSFGGAILLTDDAILKVRAYRDGMAPSEIVTTRFVKRQPVPPEIAPVISLLDWEIGKPEYAAAVEKITAIAAGDNPAVDPQTLRDWIGNSQLGSRALADSDYLVASAFLDTPWPITEEAEVAFADVEESSANGFSFKIELKLNADESPEELTLMREFVASCLQSAGTLDEGFSQTVNPDRVTIGVDGRVTITPDPTKTSEFFRIVLPKDPTKP